MIRKVRTQRKTLLVIGEGDTEVAFLKYLRSLYCSKGQGTEVTIVNAYGKSPQNVVDCAIKHIGAASYDKKICLLDTDVAWPLAVINKAKRNKIIMLGAVPCIEGLFLDILENPIPTNTDECKSKIAGTYNFRLTDFRNYSRIFDKNTLDQARQRIPLLNELLKYYEAT